uniref:Uncharacterized protein n=1 Tax=Oryza brachyantha TaxID=4533 RepID=J3LCZ3_ORYBR
MLQFPHVAIYRSHQSILIENALNWSTVLAAYISADCIAWLHAWLHQLDCIYIYLLSALHA